MATPDDAATQTAIQSATETPNDDSDTDSDPEVEEEKSWSHYIQLHARTIRETPWSRYIKSGLAGATILVLLYFTGVLQRILENLITEGTEYFIAGLAVYFLATKAISFVKYEAKKLKGGIKGSVKKIRTKIKKMPSTIKDTIRGMEETVAHRLQEIPQEIAQKVKEQMSKARAKRKQRMAKYREKLARLRSGEAISDDSTDDSSSDEEAPTCKGNADRSADKGPAALALGVAQWIGANVVSPRKDPEEASEFSASTEAVTETTEAASNPTGDASAGGNSEAPTAAASTGRWYPGKHIPSSPLHLRERIFGSAEP